MGNNVSSLTLIALVFCAGLEALSSTTATVTFSIQPITAVAISSNPAALIVCVATPGDPPNCAEDCLTTYSITTNGTGQNITGTIDSSMPSGVRLNVEMEAPPGAVSRGSVELTTTPQTLVSGISNISASNLMIDYTLSASSSACPCASQTRIITYTVTP